MKKHKEIGYQLGDVYWNNLKGFQEIWKNADFDVKEKCVNDIGKLALELCKNDTCNCENNSSGSCGCKDISKKEHDEIVFNQLANLFDIRSNECIYLTTENIKLRKYKNMFRNATIILFIISLILLLIVNHFSN